MSTNKAASLLSRFFFTRRDKVAIAGDNHPVPATVGDDAARLNRMIEAHCAGSTRIGSYTPDDSGRTVWACADFDSHGKATDIANPERAACSCVDNARKAGLAAYLERSGGGNGFHVWMFFDAPIEAEKARALVSSVLPQSAICTNGEEGRDRIEIFPKQSAHNASGKRLGNMVWLPFWGGAKRESGNNAFHHVTADCRLGEIVDSNSFAIDTIDSDLATSIGRVFMDAEAQQKAEQNKAERKARESKNAQKKPSALPQDKQIALIESALSFLSSDCHHDEWIRIGMALHDYDKGAVGFGLWDEWSRLASERYDEETTLRKWKSFKEGGVKLTALFALAKLRGYKDPRSAKKQAEQSYDDEYEQPQPESQSQPSKPKQSKRERIIANGIQDREIVAKVREILYKNTLEAMDEIATAGGFFDSRKRILLIRDGRLSMLTRVTSELGEERLEVLPLSEGQTLAVVTECADWVNVRESKDGEELVDTRPPSSVVKIIHSFPDDRLPVIAAIVNAPVYDSFGNLIATPGYHSAQKIWYAPSRDMEAMQTVPQNLDWEEVSAARDMIMDDLLIDFPFANASEKAHALAAILLPFVRRMIKEPTPLHLIEAAKAGTGKSFLADVISIIATGQRATPQTIGATDEEVEKRLVATLMDRSPVVLLDNINEAIDSESLASTLTSYPYKRGRQLQHSNMLQLSTGTVTWLATANNPRMSYELARRCARIRLVAREENPAQRKPSDFVHYPIQDWTQRNRCHLVYSCLVLVEAWKRAGRKLYTERTLGSFDGWAQIIGGILEHARVDGFLENSNDVLAVNDNRGANMRDFVTAWWVKYESREKTIRELVDFCENTNGLMAAARGEGSERSQQNRLAGILHGSRDQVISGVRIATKYDAHRKANVYYLEPTGVEETPTAQAPSAQHVDIDDTDSMYALA